MPNTNRLGLHYPAATDQANIPTDLQTLAGQIDTLVTAFYQTASQPAAEAGALWWNTSALLLNYSDGTSWYPVSAQIIVSTTQPTIISGGQFWYNPNTSNFQYYNGSSYVTLIPAITTNGQYLTSSASGPVWSNLPTSLPPTGTAGGDLTGTYPNPTLGAVGTASTYGSATAIPVITTDSKGRVTTVTTAAPSDTTKVPLSTVTTAGDTIYATGSGAVTRLAIGANGTVLTSNGSVPIWSSVSLVPPTGGVVNGYVLTNNSGTPAWAAAAATTTFSAGTTGFTPSTATSGAVTLSGTLNVANGGTGVSTIGSAGQELTVNAAGTALTFNDDNKINQIMGAL